MSENRCERCNRQLSDPTAQYGWRCAEILGVTRKLNHAGDNTFLVYMQGIESADEYLEKNNINIKNIDIMKFYESCIKQHLALEINNKTLWKLAYADAQNALHMKLDEYGYLRNSNSLTPDLLYYLNMVDNKDNAKIMQTKFSNSNFSKNIAFLQNYLLSTSHIGQSKSTLNIDGVFGLQTAIALAKKPSLTKLGKSILLFQISAKSDMKIENWDHDNLLDSEIGEINRLEENMLKAQAADDKNSFEYAYKKADNIRKKYRMSYEYTDTHGVTRIDSTKFTKFTDDSLTKNGTRSDKIPEYVVAGTIASQLDSLAPGPADLIGIAIIAGGFIISQTVAYFAKGKSNPRDLEGGMSAKQKGKFQREIEDYKKSGGMPPDYNIPWEILVEIANEIKEMYKK